MSIFEHGGKGLSAVEFCAPSTGGGKSPHLWNALRHLANAIRLDQEEAQRALAGGAE